MKGGDAVCLVVTTVVGHQQLETQAAAVVTITHQRASKVNAP